MPGATPLLAADPGRIGRYRLTGRLDGHGGSRRSGSKPAGGIRRDGAAPFVVYLGRAADGESVTITLLQALGADDTAARDRFMAEANAAREVAPFCVARMLDAGFHGDFPYLVSEHIPGPSLAEVIAAEGPPDEDGLRAIAIGAATGLAAIHQAGLVHGHFGPGQFVLGPDGPRVVHSGVTPPYGLATPAADVLSWARAVLFAGTGKPRPDLIAPGPADLRLLQSPIRQLVTECAARDPAARPPAKVIVTRLLGHGQAPAGILAAGARTAQPTCSVIRAGVPGQETAVRRAGRGPGLSPCPDRRPSDRRARRRGGRGRSNRGGHHCCHAAASGQRAKRCGSEPEPGDGDASCGPAAARRRHSHPRFAERHLVRTGTAGQSTIELHRAGAAEHR